MQLVTEHASSTNPVPIMTIGLCSLRDNVRLEHHIRAKAVNPSVAHRALCGFAELLRTKLLQFLILLRGKNRLHLWIGLLMNSPDFLHFLDS